MTEQNATPHPLRRLLDRLPHGAATALAARAGVSPQRVSDYATRRRDGFSPEAQAVARAAGMTLDQWYEREPYEPPVDTPEWARGDRVIVPDPPAPSCPTCDR